MKLGSLGRQYSGCVECQLNSTIQWFRIIEQCYCFFPSLYISRTVTNIPLRRSIPTSIQPTNHVSLRIFVHFRFPSNPQFKFSSYGFYCGNKRPTINGITTLVCLNYNGALDSRKMFNILFTVRFHLGPFIDIFYLFFWDIGL